MTLETWLAITTAEVGLIITTIGGVKWLVSKYLSELRPNGGTSIHDKINKEILPTLMALREDQLKIGEKIAKLEGRFEQHVDEVQ